METETTKPFMYAPQVDNDRVVQSLMVTSIYSFLLAALKHMEHSLGERGSAVT